MITNTKSTNVVSISHKLKERLQLIDKFEKKIKECEEKLQNIVSKTQWNEINNGVYYYIPEDSLIIPNPHKIRLDAVDFIKLSRLEWEPMIESVAYKWFYDLKEKNPIIINNRIKYCDTKNNPRDVMHVYCNDRGKHLCIPTGEWWNWSIHDTDGIKIPIYWLDATEKKQLLYFCIKNGFNLFKDKTFEQWFLLFIDLEELGLLKVVDNHIVLNIEDIQVVYQCMEKRGVFLEDTFNQIESEKLALDFKAESIVVQELLECDRLRANMELYPEHILFDPESGHWDLWEVDDTSSKATISNKLIARNPIYDALENKNGVVGIDFGTKSTVVMYRQNRAEILPMRVGSGRFSRSASKNDYENPTVMELRNVKKFMEDYNSNEGRPSTYWEDLLISHEAFEQLKSEQSKGDTFASFFSELKQWASDKTRQARLRDLQGHEIDISSYLTISEGDFDPIEIYAYYLGLFINNMRNKIYLRYKLSFPATVEKQVRDKILNSFTRGIKKSLPVQVLNDNTCMKLFKVEQGASEPAAYAITALSGYGFDPEEDEKYYYGIFDFGGGTTDFDFGVWSAEETEPENYDYQISHFGQGGDPYLGGENLLEVLSYHVFINNYEKLLKDRIVFIRPFGEKEITGKDYLVCQDSQYARFNQKRMMEKLRGVWEGDTEIRESVKSGTIALSLFTMDGEAKDNYALEVDLEELDQLLEARIEKGVSQFFDALKNCFGVNDNQRELHNVDGIHIFLAGNSSRSPIVYQMFKKYIDALKTGLKQRETAEKEWFKIYPPLGTKISDEILKGNVDPVIDEIISYLESEESIEEDNGSASNYDLSKPTGKTGVAYGLLNNRVRVLQDETEEISFQYYIGQNRKNKFYCVLDKDIQNYHTWVRFCTASREDFDIWFTRSAAAPSNKLPIDQIGIYSEVGFVAEPTPEKSVYIRMVSPTEIEYIVADVEEINNATYDKSSITKILLQER